MTGTSTEEATRRDEGHIAYGETGQGLAEYGLLIALIAAVCVAAVAALGGSILGLLGSISSL